MTTLDLRDQIRSPMIARAMTEHRIKGQIGHPAAWIIENTRLAPGKVGVTLIVPGYFGKQCSGYS
jgi:hypothetical protein